MPVRDATLVLLILLCGYIQLVGAIVAGRGGGLQYVRACCRRLPFSLDTGHRAFHVSTKHSSVQPVRRTDCAVPMTTASTGGFPHPPMTAAG